MPRLLPHEIYLLALSGKTRLGARALPTKTEAHQSLIRLTGQDFGFNVAAWEKWIRNNREEMYPRSTTPNRFTRWLDEKSDGRAEEMDLNTFQSELGKLLDASGLAADRVRTAMKEARDDIYADAEEFGSSIEEPFWNCVGLNGKAVFAFFEKEFAIFVIDCDERTLMAETDGFAMAETEACKEVLRKKFGKSVPDLRTARTVAELWLS